MRRLATTLRTARSFASAPATPRIAICGAGVSGLTLAGILSNGTREVQLTVFERARRDRDQGYGLDLDEHGQEALVRAGVYDRYWDISYPYSDTAVGYQFSGGEPLLNIFWPRLTMRLFPESSGARPETNRGGLRDILLDALAKRGNTQVHYERGAWGCRRLPRGLGRLGAGGAELLDRDGKSLGEFDLVIDAMGLHSPLRDPVRDLRVVDSVGKHYVGEMLIHGVINDIEKTCPSVAKRMDRFGTCFTLGRGYHVTMQRFGAGADLCGYQNFRARSCSMAWRAPDTLVDFHTGAEDKRTCLFYHINRPDGEEGVLREMGIDKPTSRSTGIFTGDKLRAAKEWILQDMDASFDEVWRDAMRALERVTVRGKYMHGDDTKLREGLTLPLVCIGDAPRNCGVGGGGNLAMQDANELATLLEAPHAFDEATGAANLAPLRAWEKIMFERKEAFHVERLKPPMNTRKMVEARGRGPMDWEDFREFNPLPAWVPFPVAKFAVKRFAALTKAWYAWERARGGGGTCRGNAPLYASVEKLLAEQKK